MASLSVCHPCKHNRNLLSPSHLAANFSFLSKEHFVVPIVPVIPIVPFCCQMAEGLLLFLMGLLYHGSGRLSIYRQYIFADTES